MKNLIFRTSNDVKLLISIVYIYKSKFKKKKPISTILIPQQC